MNTQFDYSLAEAREIAKQYCEVTGTDENVIRSLVPGSTLNELCEKMMSAINDMDINDNVPAGDE